MADPIRLRILYALDVTDELSVVDLAAALAASEDQITYALRLPRAAARGGWSTTGWSPTFPDQCESTAGAD